MESLYRWAYGTEKDGRTISAVYKTKTLSCRINTKVRRQTLLYVGRGTEDVESLQGHSDGSQLTVQPLQTIL